MPRHVVLDDIKITRNALLNITSLFAHEPGTCLLYSGGAFDSAQRSFLCLFPLDSLYVDDHYQYRVGFGGEHRKVLSSPNPWDGIKDLLPSFKEGSSFPEWIGYFSYEMGAHSDAERKLPCYPGSIPKAYLQKPGLVLEVDHKQEKGVISISDQAEYLLDRDQRHWIARFCDKNRWYEMTDKLSYNATSDDFSADLSFLKPLENPSAYSQKILKAQEHIQAGDIYQVNLSQQILLQGRRDPFTVFHKLVTLNPSPFCAYLRMKDFAIVSSSPERFISKKNQTLETRPIKGTMPRGKTAAEDKQNQAALLCSIKEQAELLMITDLMRNDLGKISVPGSVITDQISCCEAYENVFHLLSIIRSEALPHLHPVDIVRSCFPGGSITGCPKLSAMQFIAELEQRPRNVYTGSIGYFAGNGDFDFNIAIRTMLFTDNCIDIQLGGAIVADSDPEKEYEETLHKGASIFKVLGLNL